MKVRYIVTVDVPFNEESAFQWIWQLNGYLSAGLSDMSRKLQKDHGVRIVGILPETEPEKP